MTCLSLCRSRRRSLRSQRSVGADSACRRKTRWWQGEIAWGVTTQWVQFSFFLTYTLDGKVVVVVGILQYLQSEKNPPVSEKNGGRGRIFVIAVRFMRSPAVTFNLEGGKIVWKENNETMIFYSLGCCHPAWGSERWQNCWKLSLPHRLLQGCFAVFYTTKGLLYCRLR